MTRFSRTMPKMRIRCDALQRELADLGRRLCAANPGLQLEMWARGVGDDADGIEIFNLKVKPEQRGTGVGSAVLKAVKEFAATKGLPIVLRPEPLPRKKAALDRFYLRAGFKHNRGRNLDQRLTSPFARTMVWRPTESVAALVRG